ncbi:MAG: hypothetical protein NTW31_03585 [Bacteroidetes bacterium]|nr:hypothetical protein [Bacteroidota bacterium]
MRFSDVITSGTRFVFVLLSLILFIAPVLSQTLVVKWDFPNNPDDSIADGGILANLGKYIGTRGGAGIPAFSYPGFSTRCAGAQHWVNGANTKCWQVEFTTLSYSQLTIRSKNKSFHPQDFGPRDWLVQYRIGAAGPWTTFTSFAIRTGNQWDSLATTPLPLVCNNQSSVYIRWIMASNIPTQGNGVVNDDAYNYIDDVVVLSGCIVPTVTASPASQTICPGAPITPINIANPNNVPGTSFSWTRNNTVVLTGIPTSGTANPITGVLNSTTPQALVTTMFTITANAGGCTSVTTATITVGDNSPPVFLINPPPDHFCVQDIIQAFWNFAGDISPVRPDWFTFHSGQTNFDLNPSTFSDNCTLPSNLILHWSISLAGGGVISGTGQISKYPSDIVFPLGTSTITYWLEDMAGNLTLPGGRPVVQVIVHPRPDITRNF